MTAEWDRKQLGDVLKLEYGKPLPDEDRVVDGRFAVYGANGEKARSDRFYHDKRSIIVGRKGSAGEINLTDEKFWPLDVTYFVTFDEKRHDLKFLYYLLDTLNLPSMARGVKPGINRDDVYALGAFVPPLPEQRRIVGILDEAFAGIAAAKANAEQNRRNARAVFEGYLHDVFANRGSATSRKRLGDLGDFRNGVNFTKQSKGESIRIVGVKDFQNNFWVPMDALDVVRLDGELPAHDLLRANDVLIVRSNGNPELIGRCLLASEIEGKISHSGFTIRLRLSDGEVSPRYLCHFLKAPDTRRALTDAGTGANIKSLNQQMLSALAVPLPTRNEQEQIASAIEAYAEETQHLESLYTRKLAALDELKQSLLHQAFSGAL